MGNYLAAVRRRKCGCVHVRQPHFLGAGCLGAFFHQRLSAKAATAVMSQSDDRRGPGEDEIDVAPTHPNAVAYGGPTTAYDFPIADPAAPSVLLAASYGANSWLYNPDTNIQGREREFHWRKYGSVLLPSVTPLFLDSMWRGAGPYETDTAPEFNGEWVSMGLFGSWVEMWSFAIERPRQRGEHPIFR